MTLVERAWVLKYHIPSLQIQNRKPNACTQVPQNYNKIPLEYVIIGLNCSLLLNILENQDIFNQLIFYITIYVIFYYVLT